VAVASHLELIVDAGDHISLQVIELQQSKTKFSSDIDKLKTEGGLEASIRDKFGLIKMFL
jgi:hypothetical protein